MNIKKIKSSILSLFLLGLLLLSTPLLASADTQYVSDNLIIMMRSGAGGEYKILKTLKTGTPLEIIEEGGDYYRVQTKDGTEGWVLKRYMTVDTPKKIVISVLKQKIKRSKADLARLKSERAVLAQGFKSDKSLYKSDVRKLEKTLKEKDGLIYGTKKELQQMTYKYKRLLKSSANVVKVVKERDKLSKDNVRLSAENKSLSQRNKSLFRKSAILWFLAGAFVFFFGWAVGQVSRRKRRRF